MERVNNRCARWLGSVGLAAIGATLVFGNLGCEEKEKTQPVDAGEPAMAVASVVPDPTPAPDPAPAPTPPPRPESIDTELTSERRAAIEKAYPDARGFVVAAEIEESLKKNAAVSAKEAAVQAFDRAAKNKWVLLAGPLTNPTDEGFELGITYTPRAANDPMGMSRQWFPISLTGIEGYEKDKFKVGANVVVLAKYDGDAKATSGFELVEAKHWQ